MSDVKKRINPSAVFKPRTKNDDNAELSEAIVTSARKTGHLNLSSRGLFTVPTRVWNINQLTEEELKGINYELDYVAQKDERWWEQEPLKNLDLSHNSLSAIDSKIEGLTELTVLRLQDNLLRELPPQFGSLKGLREVNLSNNKLEKLPIEFYKLTELRKLELKNNFLEEIDPATSDLIMLSHLDLSGNKLRVLPAGLGYLVRLTTLDVSHNMLTELPPDLTSMRALEKLDSSHNELEASPPMGELRKVETVILQKNKLTTFPDMSGCTLLRVLHLADNGINELDMGRLEGVGRLKVLTLGNNKIETIPEDVTKLTGLEVLDLSGNNISVIPHCIGVLPNLKQIILDGNDIKNVRADIIRCGTSRILKHIRQNTENPSLGTIEYELQSASTNIYPDKYGMRSTKLLSLAGQNLSELPEEVLKDAQAADVATVDLSRNKLSALPEQLSTIDRIADLKVASNQLTYLPEWIGEKYKYLQTLDISKNGLQSLPTSLGSLKYLRDIDISFNRYTEVPESIYGVVSLEILNASDNLIRDIDANRLKELGRLATLNLANNDIRYVPPELGNLTHLRNVVLTGNSFKQPRQAILTKSTEELLAYLRNRIPI